MSSLSMRELLEAGAHFGHQTRFWSPKMSQYIFGSRNKIHIINLEKTVAKFDEAAKFLTNLAAQKGTILFVGTKRTSRDAIVAEAKRAGMPYVDQRWLGGMLTNFKTVKVSLKRLKEMEQKVADGALEKMTKKEALDFTRELEKLNKAMGGIKEMNGLPDALVVVDLATTRLLFRKLTSLVFLLSVSLIRTTILPVLTMSSRVTTTAPALLLFTLKDLLTQFLKARTRTLKTLSRLLKTPTSLKKPLSKKKLSNSPLLV